VLCAHSALPCYTLTLVSGSALAVLLIALLADLAPDGTYANPAIIEAPLQHRTRPLTWLTLVALAADVVTRVAAQTIGVVHFDLLFYGLIVPGGSAMAISWKLARYPVPNGLVRLTGLGGLCCTAILGERFYTLGSQRMYDRYTEALGIVSNALHVPYYDLNALCFVVIPGAIAVVLSAQSLYGLFSTDATDDATGEACGKQAT
jgi:hypothetical protein